MKVITNYLNKEMRFFILGFVLMLYASNVSAQKIDFDNGTTNNPTASGYTAWDITNGETVTNTFDGVTISITNAEGSAGSKIKKNWNKNGVTIGTDEGRLVSDGISSFDGDSYIKSGSVAIQVTITGLSAGTHTLQAYHNNVDYEAGATLPNMNVKVNGTDQVTGLVQSMRATTFDASTKSFVTFDVASTSSETVIIYYTTPDDNVKYDRTQLYINSLEFDGDNADYQAQNPYPANLDYHVDADNGNLTMSWTAASGATKHQVYFGDDESQVKNASNYDVETTSTTFTRHGLNPMQTYYWRVDEVIDGKVYRGIVWSFKPRRDAFPGAQGYGRYAIGGRGGTVYHVTSLEDDADNPAEGTFRYGITRLSGPRTIVFDVGGVIHLKNRLTCNDPYVTIAGQTAPGNGIMFRGAPIGLASDGIMRFVRLRRGHLSDEDPDGHGMDGLGMAGNDHSIIDHCSISWTIDEAFSSRNAKHITLQNTLISEALNIAGHPNYDAGAEHGYAGTIGGGQLGAKGSSFHHNLLAHNEGRNWSMSGGLDASGAYDGHHDMFNNVCYNWATRATDGGTHEGQFVNNYYKMGASTTMTYLLRAQLEGTGSGSQSYYVSGNIRENLDGSKTSDAENVTYKYELYNDQVLDWTVFRNSPFFDHLATVESAEAAYKNVLSDVGCNQPAFDNHDARMVSETKNRTYTYTGSASLAKGRYGHIDSETDSEGFGGLNIFSAERDADWDTDGDGIPNWFETEKGWSADGVNNNHTDQNQDYYTDLEIYLNWMALPHWINQMMNVPIEIDLRDYFAGYSNTSGKTSYSIGATSGLTTNLSDYLLTVTPTRAGLLSLEITATERVGSETVSLTRTFNFHIVSSEDIYNEATVTTEEVSYMLDTQTYNSTASTTTIWRFTNGFEVSNDNKGYSAGLENCIKYSANVPFTIHIPDGLTVTEVTFYGYDNYDGGDSYLSMLGDMAFSSTDYVFPQKSSSGDRYPVTHTISLSTPVSNSLTFKFSVKQTVVKINLKCVSTSNVSVTLKETATVFLPFKNGSKTVFSAGDLPINNANITLIRTLSSEYWNTLCLPFDVSNEQVMEVFGEGTKVSEFASAINNTINFSSVEGIRAGVPCIIKPANTVENPMFENVNLTSSSPGWIYQGAYHFDGHYIGYDMKTDQTEYFLNTRGTLNYPANDSQNHLKGLRATFTVPKASIASLASLQVFFDEKMVSEGLDVVDHVDAINGLTHVFPVYNLNGQTVCTTDDRLPKGVYIVNGKKKVIR